MAGNVGSLSLLPSGTTAILEDMTRSSHRSGVVSALRRRPLRVAMLAFPDVQVLDVMGPLEVFSRSSRWMRDEGRRRDLAYRVEVIGLRRGPFRASSGVRLHADYGLDDAPRDIDTLMIAGGVGIERYRRHAPLLRWIRRRSRTARRLASICTGAFLLAEAGLLDGRRATTHWHHCDDFARAFPGVRLEPDTIFVRDGAISTSAGVTTGMDLALAMVEEDFGRDVALAAARELVLFVRRPGGQAQFSVQLERQIAERQPLRELQTYILDHPDADLSVQQLARRVAMSPRHFARVFQREVGTSPAKYVGAVRVETARRLLEETQYPITMVCDRSGLGTPESMRRAFVKALGVAPSSYRARFNRSQGSAESRSVGSSPSRRSR